jgi:hypothetical protein
MAVITDGRRKRLGMAGRLPRGVRGGPQYPEPLAFDSHPFFSGPWGDREI